jgi:hypothetical protein
MLKTVSSITNAIGALNYKGTWDANANSPALASSVGTKGDYYVVSTAGSTNLNGISNWGVGDWAAYNGSVWQRVEGGADGNFVNLSVTGTSTLADTKAIGDVITSLDQTGIYAVASFGKTSIATTVTTDICVLTGDAEMFGFVEVLYAIEDPGTDVYVGRKTYRMFWAGATALFNLISSEDSGALIPTFTSSGSGSNFTIKVTAISLAATYNANFTIRWHTYAVPFGAIAITEA